MRRHIGMVLVAGFAAFPSIAAADRWDTAVTRAKTFADQREGVVAFAVIDEGRELHGSRMNDGWYSASLLKPVILGTFLNRPSVRRRALTAGERSLLSPMIRASADDPANRLIVDLTAPRVQRFGRRTGLFGLGVTLPIWGSSRITPADYARFIGRLPGAIPARHRPYARNLLKTIVTSQRWGIGEVSPPGWRLLFKGGWRAGRGYGRIVNQAARLECDDKVVSLAILTDKQPSHGYGTRTVRGVARRVLAPLSRGC